MARLLLALDTLALEVDVTGGFERPGSEYLSEIVSAA
jgi:hypothetical protein